MMRTVLCIAVLAAVLCGCEDEHKIAPDSPEMNRWLVETTGEMAVNNAIVRQHTLFPYHFVENASWLNELGERDLYVLTRHYRTHGGPLNIRRGGADDQLYQARVDAVSEALREGGVDLGRVEIADAQAGGDGMPSERVLVILEQGAVIEGYISGDGGMTFTSGN